MLSVNQLIGFGSVSIAVEQEIDGGHSTTTGNHQNVTNFDRTFTIPNNATVIGISVFSNTAASIRVKIAEAISSTELDVNVDESFSHGGSGWERHDLSSSYSVPATGNHHAGEHDNTAGVEGASGTPALSRKDGDIGLGQTTGWSTSSTAGKLALVRVHYFA